MLWTEAPAAAAVAVGPLEAGPAAAAERAEPVTDALSQHLQFLAPALDPRVLRRAARELWNSCAGVSTKVYSPKTLVRVTVWTWVQGTEPFTVECNGEFLGFFLQN